MLKTESIAADYAGLRSCSNFADRHDYGRTDHEQHGDLLKDSDKQSREQARGIGVIEPLDNPVEWRHARQKILKTIEDEANRDREQSDTKECPEVTRIDVPRDPHNDPDLK